MLTLAVDVSVPETERDGLTLELELEEREDVGDALPLIVCDGVTDGLAVTDGETEPLAVTDGVRDGVGLVVVLTDGVGTRLV